MNEQQAFVIESRSGDELHGILHLSGAPGPRPTVIICHGFKGFMEWGFFPSVADLLAERGFTVLRFNYSGTGMRPGDELVTDPDAFKRNTFSKELVETLRVLEAVGTELGQGRVDRERLALFGHSRGGGAATLAAAHPEWRDRLRAVVTWAAVATYDRFGGEKTAAAWRQAGSLPIANTRTGQALELGLELLDDIENHRQELDLLAAASRRKAPWLIVHGEDDESVPVAEAHQLHDHAQAPKELLTIPGANHTFGAKHPFAGPTPQLIQAMNATQSWLRRHLV